MRVVVDPEATIGETRDWSIPRLKMFSVLAYQQVLSLKQVVVDVIDDADRSVVGIAP
jgi:hypothetical protein